MSVYNYLDRSIESKWANPFNWKNALGTTCALTGVVLFALSKTRFSEGKNYTTCISVATPTFIIGVIFGCRKALHILGLYTLCKVFMHIKKREVFHEELLISSSNVGNPLHVLY